MRVVIATGIYPPSVGGPATYAKILHDELPKHDIQVVVVSFDSVRKFPKGISHLIYLLKLFFKSLSTDIIFALDPVSVGYPAMFSAKILRKKFILRIGGYYSWEQAHSIFGVTDLPDTFLKTIYDIPKIEKLKKVETQVAQFAQRIIVPSNDLKRILGLTGVDEDKIEVVYNSFNKGNLENIGSQETVRAELDISGKVVLSSGRLIPLKGFDALIDICAALRKKYDDLKLIIIGDGPEEKNLKEKVVALGLEDVITILDRQQKEMLFKYTKAADVFVLNTQFEGMSNTILEAMSLGVPVIATNAGGNPEVIKDGIDGLLIEVGDNAALEASIEKVLYGDIDMDTLLNRAYEKINMFDKEKMVESSVRILKS